MHISMSSRKNASVVKEARSGFRNISGQMNLFSALLLKPRSLLLPWERIITQEKFPIFRLFPKLEDELNWQWQSMRDHRKNEANPTLFDNFAKERELSHVFLEPSPGEQFWLKIDCRDGFLQNVTVDLSIKVSKVKKVRQATVKKEFVSMHQFGYV